jgi:DNA-binding NarL/FixJ family response regulator
MAREPVPATENQLPPARPRVLLLADETMLTMGLFDLLGDQAELKVLPAHQPPEEIITTILQWEPDVILLTSGPPASYPCPWEWVRRLKRQHCCIIRLLLQDNSIDICHVHTMTITHLGDLVRLILTRPASNTTLIESGEPGRQ